MLSGNPAHHDQGTTYWSLSGMAAIDCKVVYFMIWEKSWHIAHVLMATAVYLSLLFISLEEFHLITKKNAC